MNLSLPEYHGLSRPESSISRLRLNMMELKEVEAIFKPYELPPSSAGCSPPKKSSGMQMLTSLICTCCSQSLYSQSVVSLRFFFFSQ
jgi:hypothetical protein